MNGYEWVVFDKSLCSYVAEGDAATLDEAKAAADAAALAHGWWRVRLTVHPPEGSGEPAWTRYGHAVGAAGPPPYWTDVLGTEWAPEEARESAMVEDLQRSTES